MSARIATKIYLLLSALAIGALGLLIGGLEVLAIVDPVGTKMSDDADPFGDPTISIWQHIVMVVLATCCFVISALLLKRMDKRI